MAKDIIINDSDSKWYVILTRLNYEYKVKRDFVDGLLAHNLLDDVEDIFIPIKKFVCEYTNLHNQTRVKTISEKIMSSYIFVKLRMSNLMYGYTQNLVGSYGFLKAGDIPSYMSEKEVEYYRKK